MGRRNLRRGALGLTVLAVAAVAYRLWFAAPGAGPTPEAASPGPCGPHPFVPEDRGPFAHTRSRLVATSGAPAHAAHDVLVAEGSPVSVEAKFAYGLLSKDLEDEPVRVFLDTCDGWARVGETRTDDDGRASLRLPSLGRGVHGLRFQVRGDASLAEASVWVLPRGTRLSVFDIDGTLTTSDLEIFKDFEADLLRPLLRGDYVPKAYPGAVELTRAQAARGYVNVYLTGRPYWLTRRTREWLSALGFAPGALRLTDSSREALPTSGGVGEFKLRYLKRLAEAGFVLDVAHGNAATDIDAYLGAGIPTGAVFIIGRHGGERGTQAVGASWEMRVREVRALPPVPQP